MTLHIMLLHNSEKHLSSTNKIKSLIHKCKFIAVNIEQLSHMR